MTIRLNKDPTLTFLYDRHDYPSLEVFQPFSIFGISTWLSQSYELHKTNPDYDPMLTFHEGPSSNPVLSTSKNTFGLGSGLGFGCLFIIPVVGLRLHNYSNPLPQKF